MRLADPSGKVMHAEIKIGDSIVMLADEFPEMGAKSPQTIGGSPVGICLYVPTSMPASSKRSPPARRKNGRVKDQFYGDRSGTLRDPFGHNGRSPRIKRTSRPRKSASGPRNT